jgi:predicted house-cleaning noncanonical NTP pyrophosphatase (MazG superfamily)
MAINVRDLVKECIIKEGKKVSINIANGFEYSKIFLKAIGEYDDKEILQLINRYRK